MLYLLIASVLGSRPGGRPDKPIHFAGKSGFDYGAWKHEVDNHIYMGAQMGVPGNVVSYREMKESYAFKRAVESLATADLTELSLNESLALGCNAYNIFAANMVIENACRVDAQGNCLGPIFGLDDIPDWANLKIHNLGGNKYSLHEIEAMMRPVPSAPLFDTSKGPIKEDLRVHACLICGGISCPDIRFYGPKRVNEQLDSITTDWMANPYKGMRIDKANNKVTWSMIMSWYNSEFLAQGGSIAKAYEKFLPKEATEFFAASNGNYTEEYMGYVWDSNGPVPCSCLPKTDSTKAVDLREHGSGRIPSSHIKEP